MHRAKEIERALSDKGVNLANEIIQDEQGEPIYYAFVKVERDSKGRQKPSNYQLKKIQQDVVKREEILHYVFIDQTATDLQASLRGMLLRRFSEDIRNAFAKIDAGSVSVWIEPKLAIDKSRYHEIHRNLQELIGVLGFNLANVENLSALNLPTKTACNIRIRLHAPLSIEELEKRLIEAGFEIPNRAWLARTLDKSRKSGLVQRQANGTYVLTLKGLKALGTSKNSVSPDVRRALDLAKRK